jgi:enoyl-CoA hydratase/carnithine racemase
MANHIPTLKDSLLTLQNRVATLTFNRDDVRNALTGTALIDDILTTIDWVNTNEDISVLIITGAGRAFSAGGNIKEMLERDTTHREGAFGGDVYEVQNKYRRGIQRIPKAIYSCEIPVIAAINGPAIGAGFDISCMCDIRIGSENALLGETFINLGIIPGDGGAWFLQRLIGYQAAAEMTFTGRLVEAPEALEMGLLLNVVPADDLMLTAYTLAESIANKPPQALRLTKRLMKTAQRQELSDFLDLCATFQGMCHNTDDHLEAVEAFVNKRDPSFSGK